jgi:acyl-CoA synthetase (AMP-forming)/AMP-acid ligase II
VPNGNDLILAEISRAQAEAIPDAAACTFQGRSITYRELDARANCIAQGLIAEGIRPGDRVAVLAKNSDTFLEITVGILKAGGVLLPLNWRLAPPEVAFILEHGEAKLVFSENEFLSTASDANAGARKIISMGKDHATVETFAPWRDRQYVNDPSLKFSPDDVILQMYTSGTTGLPKGVQLTNRNYGNSFDLMESMEFQRIPRGQTLFAPAPFFHVNGLNAAFRSLHTGARLVTIDQFRPAEVVETFERERVNRATLAPAMIQMCLDVPGVEKRDFSSLKIITYGGSPISERVLTRAAEVFGCRFAQGYGMTETSGAIAMLAPDDHAPGRNKLLSCGRPIKGAEVRVVDPSDKPCVPRQIGEVVVRGAVVTQGYWRDPAATGRAIVDGWMHTGDAGYFDEDGYLYIHDRIKEMIVSGAENIYPAEVENALFHHADVADVAVIGVPDSRWGEAVKALVVPKPGRKPSAEDIIATARQHIAGYKLPKSVDFIDAIPRNAAGKILRRELRKPYWESAGRNVN